MRLWLRVALLTMLLGLPPSAFAQTTNYPGSVDDTSTLCDPTPTAATNGACKAAENAAAQNHAIIAVEDKVGTGASTPQAGYLLEGTGTGTSAYTAPGVAITPAPTATPRATDTPIPADTLVPTATPRATDTPIPADTLVPTATREARGFSFSTATPASGCIESAVSTSQEDCVSPSVAVTVAPTATPRSTDTPIPAAATATREAQTLAFSTSTPAAGCWLYDAVGGGSSSVVSCATPNPTATIIATATPRATDTPIPTATANSGGVLGITSTELSGTTTMTNAATYYTAVTLGISLAASGVYGLAANILIQDQNTVAGNVFCLIYDNTNSVTITQAYGIYPASVSGDFLAITMPMWIYSGYSGTPTIIVKCQSNNGGDKEFHVTGDGITAVRLG